MKENISDILRRAWSALSVMLQVNMTADICILHVLQVQYPQTTPVQLYLSCICLTTAGPG